MENDERKFESCYMQNSIQEETERYREDNSRPYYTAGNEEKLKPKKKRGAGKIFGMIALILVAAFIGGFGGAKLQYSMVKDELALYAKNLRENVIETENKVEAKTIVREESMTAAEYVAKKAEKSVVAVTSLELTGNNPWTGSKLREGMGSGVIVSKDGYILTNSHVISKNPKKVTVFLAGEDITLMKDRRYSQSESEEMGHPAEVIWNDPENDLAMIKISTKEPLQPAELGNSDDVHVGETAIAIGNPIDANFKGTVTQGIVSGLNRTVVVKNASEPEEISDPFGMFFGNSQPTRYESNEMTGLIQTDAAINSGNSGGPLLNAKGEVIGINTVKVASSGVDSLGFAIPINNAKAIMDRVKSGETRTVFLGISNPYPVSEYQERLGVDLGIESGIICMGIVENSSAEKAGLLPNDIITEIDGKKISNQKDLLRVLRAYKVGDKAEVKFISQGSEKKIEVEFISWNEETKMQVNMEQEVE